MAWPNSPAVGDRYQPNGSSGPTYVYTGSKIWQNIGMGTSSAPQAFTLTDGQTSISVNYQIGAVAVYRNGARQTETQDFVATNGTSITLVDPGVAGHQVIVIPYSIITTLDGLQKSLNLSDLPDKAAARSNLEIGWRNLAKIIHTTSTSSPDVVAIPADVTEVRIGGRFMQTINDAVLGLQFSLDNGTTFITTTAYGHAQMARLATGFVSSNFNANYIALTSTASAVPYIGRALNAKLTFGGSDGQVHNFSATIEGWDTTAGAAIGGLNAGSATFTQRPTHLRLIPSSGQIGAGSKFLFEGW